MNRHLVRSCAIVLFVLIAATGVSQAEDPVPQSVLPPGTPQAIWADIQVRLETQKIQLSELLAQRATETDPDRRIELEREYQEIKTQTELDIMGIQLHHAQIRGDQELVGKLEQAIHRMEHPEEVIRELQSANPTPPGQGN